VARRIALLTALALLGALATALPAQASHGCSAWRSSGAKLVVKNREAVVFTKRGFVYGCLSSVGTVRRLPDEGGGIHVSGTEAPQLSGRYVAFATFGSAIGDEFDRLYVYDLRLGRTRLVEGSTAITDIALKRNGSVAWIEASTVDPGGDQPVWDVRRWSAVDRQGAVLLDRGADIGRGSLVLSEDRLTVSWTRNNGPVRSAPLN
jgi:hypothetical protein